MPMNYNQGTFTILEKSCFMDSKVEPTGISHILFFIQLVIDNIPYQSMSENHIRLQRFKNRNLFWSEVWTPYCLFIKSTQRSSITSRYNLRDRNKYRLTFAKVCLLVGPIQHITPSQEWEPESCRWIHVPRQLYQCNWKYQWGNFC